MLICLMTCVYRHICVLLSHLMQAGQTALHKASSRGYLEIVTTLLKYGASVDLKDKVRLLFVHDQYCVDKNGVSGLDNLFCRMIWSPLYTYIILSLRCTSLCCHTIWELCVFMRILSDVFGLIDFCIG